MQSLEAAMLNNDWQARGLIYLMIIKLGKWELDTVIMGSKLFCTTDKMCFNILLVIMIAVIKRDKIFQIWHFPAVLSMISMKSSFDSILSETFCFVTCSAYPLVGIFTQLDYFYCFDPVSNVQRKIMSLISIQNRNLTNQ